MLPSKRHRLEEEAKSLKHMMSHYPQNPFCRVCNESKAKERYRHQHTEEEREAKMPEGFGTLVTADHMVLRGEKDVGADGSADVLLTFVVGTGCEMFQPALGKTTAEVRAQLLNFSGKDAIVEFYTDQAEELIKAWKELGWMHIASEA
jgi:ethanolamine utilization cobalamin adenosyltransferase